MIKVLVVDDSEIMCKIICKILAQDPVFEVRSAADPYEARRIIKSFKPQVMTLDIEMPKMDGITFLKNLMQLYPMPVVMLSTLTQRGAEAAVLAMEIGAVDFIGKPKGNSSDGTLVDFSESLLGKIKVAAHCYHIIRNKRTSSLVKSAREQVVIDPQKTLGKIIAIGASTGGVEAIKVLLTNLSNNLPPIVITQHMPKVFSEKFALRLNNSMALTVKEAQEGDVLKGGTVYIAPGGSHLQILKQGGYYVCHLDNSAKVNMHRPSVDVMFDSMSALVADNLLLVLLTGMGKDGALGMENLYRKGAYCMAQNKETSIVWGMPGSAVALKCVHQQLALNDISYQIESHYAVDR